MKEFQELMKESKPKKENSFDIYSPSTKLSEVKMNNNNNNDIFKSPLNDPTNSINKIDTQNSETKFNDKNTKKDLSDEEILNNLLGLSSNLNNPLKKENTNKKIKTNNDSPFIVPGTEGIDSPKIKTEKDEKKKETDFSFFDALDKEMNSVPKTSVNNITNNNSEKLSSDLGINKLFENIVKEEEKAQDKRLEEAKKTNLENKKISSISPIDLNLETNLNQTSQKLDKELKKIPISLAQLDIEKEEIGLKKKKNKVSLKRNNNIQI